MTPHKKNDPPAASPFEQVRTVEDHEHARVEEAKRTYEAAILEKLRAIDTEALEKQEALRLSKSQELKKFATTETGTVITSARKDAERESSALHAHAMKHQKHVEDDLLKKALDPSFLFSA